MGRESRSGPGTLHKERGVMGMKKGAYLANTNFETNRALGSEKLFPPMAVQLASNLSSERLRVQQPLWKSPRRRLGLL